MSKFLQEHRVRRDWQCGICKKVISGTRNTIHLGIKAHRDSEIRKGLRNEQKHYDDKVIYDAMRGGVQ